MNKHCKQGLVGNTIHPIRSDAPELEAEVCAGSASKDLVLMAIDICAVCKRGNCVYGNAVVIGVDTGHRNFQELQGCRLTESAAGQNASVTQVFGQN